MNKPDPCPHHPNYIGKRPPFSRKLGCTCEAIYNYARAQKRAERTREYDGTEDYNDPVNFRKDNDA